MGGTRDQRPFSCLCWELPDERQQGGLPTSQQGHGEARLVQSHLQTPLLCLFLQLSARTAPSQRHSHSLAASRLLLLHELSPVGRTFLLLVSCLQSLHRALLLKQERSPALEHPLHRAFYCSHSLQAMAPPKGARSAVFRKAHGLAKARSSQRQCTSFHPRSQETSEPPSP